MSRPSTMGADNLTATLLDKGTKMSTLQTATGNERPQDNGHEPDYRFTLANERTFLAWIRTALALVAAGLAIVQLLPPFPGIRWGPRARGIPLILLGAVVAGD